MSSYQESHWSLLGVDKEMFIHAISKFPNSEQDIINFLNTVISAKYETRLILVIYTHASYSSDMWYYVIPRDETQKYKDLIANYDNLGLGKFLNYKNGYGEISDLELVVRYEHELKYAHVVTGDNGYPVAKPATEKELAAVEKLPTKPHDLIKKVDYDFEFSHYEKDLKNASVFWANEDDVRNLIEFIDMDKVTLFTYCGASCSLEAGRLNKWYLHTSSSNEAIQKMIIHFAKGSLQPLQ